VPDDIRCLEDSLYRASLDIELIVAEAIPPFFWREVPIRHCSITQVPPDQHVDTADNMPHHAVTYDNDLLKPRQDVANLFRSKPPKVAASRHVWCIMTDTTTPRHSL